MILVPLFLNTKTQTVQTNKQNGSDTESNDRNKQEPHDPVKAGKEAIEAGKWNERDKPAGQQGAEEAKDAEAWRNEG